MRPVDRGPNPGGYTEYTLAYRPLVDRIGRYCSYCEAPLKNGDVEHVLPKKEYPTLGMSWDNFLVACLNCNSTKRVWPTVALSGRAAGLWPDEDNTARAFEYPMHLPPRPATALGTSDQTRAMEMLVHLGIERSPTHPDWSAKDDRWEMRNEVWDKALDCRQDLAGEDTVTHRKRIADVAKYAGFWSVWRAVFVDDADMLCRLNGAFKGTDASSFDAATSALLPRPGGQI